MFKRNYKIDEIHFSSIYEYIDSISNEVLFYVPIKLYRRHLDSLIQVGIPDINTRTKVANMLCMIPPIVINLATKWLNTMNKGKMIVWVIAENNNPTSGTRVNINHGQIEVIIT